MIIWGITDTGLLRKENQDAYSSRMFGEQSVAVVCDGMGGTMGGRIASSVAVENFIKYVATSEGNNDESQWEQLLKNGVKTANNAIKEEAVKDPKNKNMGTTLVGAIVNKSKATICNVGDSRAYHITEDGIKQISHDHSVVEKLVESGDLTPLQAKHHPNRNLITRALGPDEDPMVDCFNVNWNKGEFILLCTDGLVNTVSDMEILYEVIYETDIEHCLDRLVDVSNTRGAPDNVTAVLVMND